MTYIPIKVNCIIEAGVRYCENKDITAHEGGIILLVSSGLLIWVMAWIYVAVNMEKPLIALVCSVLLPLLITGLILLN